MSANTTLLVHVPVDEIEILRGSLGAFELSELRGDPNMTSLTLAATLRTDASARPFKRSILLRTVDIENRSDGDHRATFTGTFAGQPIAGVYYTRSRRGSFRSLTD